MIKFTICLLFTFLIPFVIILADPPAKEPIDIQNAFPNLKFKEPVDLTYADDGTDRIFVVEKGGKIIMFDNNPHTKNSSIFLDISDLGFLAVNPLYNFTELIYRLKRCSE